MVDDPRANRDSGAPDDDAVENAGKGIATNAARDAASGASADQVAQGAATGAVSAAQAAGAPGASQAATAVQTASAVAGAGQGIAQAAQGGGPASAIGAVGGVAGAAGAVAGAGAAASSAQSVAQAAGAAQQAAGAAQQAAGAAQQVAGVAQQARAAAPAGLVQALEQTFGSLMPNVPARLEGVRFHFALTQGPEIRWHVRRYAMTSELSRPYELRLQLVCDDVTAPVDEMLGAPCEVQVERGDLVHIYYGIIDEIDDLGPQEHVLHASVRVVPAFSLLADQIDTRIFQGQTVVEILTDVLGAALAPYGREVDTQTYLHREYNPRDYCTQFRESTLEFCCRLMEEEGIAFHFLPDEDGRREKLVLIDSNADYPEIDAAFPDVPVIPANPEEADRESIRGVTWRQRRVINKVSGRAYNFKTASTYDEASASVQETHNHQDQELYLHDLRRQITDDPIGDPPAASYDGSDLTQREPMVAQVLEEQRARSKIASGRGNVTGFRPGTRFTLGSHHRADLDGAELLLLRVVQRGEANTENMRANGEFENEFHAIPVAHEFRPEQRHRRAKVYGPQLARVVGLADSDEEIHTDKYGRIKVQFHHDRLQPADSGASVWVRVMQPWAGSGWGTVFIPRVGMEVVVQFVDGNPDNPVVTGSVYNSDNMPPYTLPDEKTKSTIKSSSSVGGDGYNELTFEDAAGREQIIVHAQKDFNKTVLNNQTRSVGANDSTSVGGDQSLSVTGDRTHSITGNKTITVNGSQKITIVGASTGDGQTITGGQLDITGKYKLDASQSIEVQAPDYILFTVGSTFMKIEPDRITMQQKNGARVVLSPDSALVASKENSQLVLTADGHMQANTGGDLLLTVDAQLSAGGAQVLLNGDALVQSKGKAEMKLDANAKVSGATATMDAKTDATVSAGTSSTLTAGGSTVKTTSAAAEVTGPQANISGNGAVNIAGGIIKLN